MPLAPSSPKDGHRRATRIAHVPANRAGQLRARIAFYSALCTVQRRHLVSPLASWWPPWYGVERWEGDLPPWLGGTRRETKGKRGAADGDPVFSL